MQMMMATAHKALCRMDRSLRVKNESCGLDHSEARVAATYKTSLETELGSYPSLRLKMRYRGSSCNPRRVLKAYGNVQVCNFFIRGSLGAG